MPVEIAVQRRILLVLAATQVLGGVGVAGAIAVSALLASRLSGSEVVGGLAQTGQVLGAAGASSLRWLGGRARRASVVVAAPAGRSRWPRCRGPRGRPLARACSRVRTAAGRPVPASGLAARPRARAVPAVRTGAFTLAALGTWTGLRPDPLLLARGAEETDSARPPAGPAEVRGRAAGLACRALGLGGIVLGHLLMVGLMSMTPVHMDHGGATLAVVGLVISLHVAGMYALSPLFGWLADRAGRARVLALAAVLLLVSGVLCALAGPADTGLLTVGLVLLGLGWSAGLVAGSALLTESVPARVRPALRAWPTSR